MRARNTTEAQSLRDNQNGGGRCADCPGITEPGCASLAASAEVTPTVMRPWCSLPVDSARVIGDSILPCAGSAGRTASNVVPNFDQGVNMPAVLISDCGTLENNAAAKPVFVEVCCGSAGLSASVSQYGFDCIGVDCRRNRHAPKARVLEIDLSTPDGCRLLCDVCRQPEVAVVWLGIPSASRVRDIGPGLTALPPLRSAREPWGRTDIDIDAIQTGSAARLAAANAVYCAMLQAISVLDRRGVPWAIENPVNSLVWMLPQVIDLLSTGAKDYLYDTCMFGDERKRTRRVRATLDLERICITCDNRHKHAQWKVRLEDCSADEYSPELCHAFSQAIASDAKVRNCSCKVAKGDLLPAAIAAALPPGGPGGERDRRAGVGLQLRTAPNICPEYKQNYDIVVDNVGTVEDVLDDKGFVTNPIPCRMGVISVGHRVVSIKKGQDEGLGGVISVGVPWTPLEFTELALKTPHPFELLAEACDDTKKAVFMNLCMGPADMATLRQGELAKWRARARELQADEDADHLAAHPEVRPCLAGKKVRLLEEMAAAAGFPSSRLLAQMLWGGCPVLGSSHLGEYFHSLAQRRPRA